MQDVVRDLSMLAEPARVRLLAALDEAELGVAELVRVLQLPQSTVSRHLKALRTAGWVRRRSVGTSSLHGADLEAVGPVGQQLWATVGAAFAATHQAREDRVRLAAALAERDGDSFFGRVATGWDEVRRELFGSDFLTTALPALLPPHWVIADLGCGTGELLDLLAPVVERVIGVDREPKMLDAARARTSRHPNVDLLEGALASLPLDPATIDAATCLLVLHHVDRPDAVWSEVCRVLKPGGTFVVVDMQPHDRHDWRHTMGHRHLGFDRDSVVGMAEAGGLQLVQWRGLAPAPEAQGPPLFLANFTRPAN